MHKAISGHEDRPAEPAQCHGREPDEDAAKDYSDNLSHPCILPSRGATVRHITKEGSMAAKKPHPGFKKAQQSIAKKQGVSQESAAKILAASARKASPAAKRANPRIKRVSGA
jgi:hypothetical protein